MTYEEVANGLVLPYMSQAVAGKGRAAAILLILFMVTIESLFRRIKKADDAMTPQY